MFTAKPPQPVPLEELTNEQVKAFLDTVEDGPRSPEEAAVELLKKAAQERVNRCVAKCKQALTEENVTMLPQVIIRGNNIETDVIFVPN